MFASEEVTLKQTRSYSPCMTSWRLHSFPSFFAKNAFALEKYLQVLPLEAFHGHLIITSVALVVAATGTRLRRKVKHGLQQTEKEQVQRLCSGSPSKVVSLTPVRMLTLALKVFAEDMGWAVCVRQFGVPAVNAAETHQKVHSPLQNGLARIQVPQSVHVQVC